jgi:tetratricopeptide (TPR) repeat protein
MCIRTALHPTACCSLAALTLSGLVALVRAGPACGAGAATGDVLAAATAEYERGDLVAASVSYSRAIADIERQDGPASAQLVEPLAGYAQTQIGMHRPDAAIDTLRRAVGVVRRSAGVHDARQYPLLERLTDLYSSRGDLDEAGASLAYMARVSESAYGKRSVEHARSMTRIADWQCRIGEFDAARRSYRRSIELLDRHAHGDALVDALLGLARCCLEPLSAEGIETTRGSLERYRGPVARSNRMSADSPAFHYHIGSLLRAEGEQSLRRAVQIVESAPLDPDRQAIVLLQAGDWFQIKDHRRTALHYYSRAQSLRMPGGPGPDEDLSAPEQVLYPLPATALRGRGATTGAHYVEIEFTVLANGRVDAQRVVAREAGKSAVDETLSSLRAARYRPRVVAGRAVDTGGVRMRQVFPDIR